MYFTLIDTHSYTVAQYYKINWMMMFKRSYSMCMNKLQEYVRALELYKSGRHDQAS